MKAEEKVLQDCKCWLRTPSTVCSCGMKPLGCFKFAKISWQDGSAFLLLSLVPVWSQGSQVLTASSPTGHSQFQALPRNKLRREHTPRSLSKTIVAYLGVLILIFVQTGGKWDMSYKLFRSASI